MIVLRRYRDGDADGCAAVFERAVHEGAARHYTAEQRAAWAPPGPRPREAALRFADRLARQITWVAVRGTDIAGFMSLRPDGYVDFTYVAPEEMGSGLAGRLYERILGEARALGLTRLTSEASHLARPFFARHGWRIDAPQEVERLGVKIPNFRMSLDL